MGKTSEQITDQLSQIIRVGYVTARQPEKHRVQVQCKDTVSAPLTTDWLLVLTPRASSDLHYDLPDIGDQVLCLFLPIGIEQGFVIGAMYGKQEPPVKDAEKTHRTFKDGTMIEYDRGAHQLTADVKGNVMIHASGNITMVADGTFIVKGATTYVNS